MPAFIRLVAGVIVLLVVEAVVLGFPGIQQNITGTSISIANLSVFFIGLIVAFIVLKFGTQLANTVSHAYKAYKTWTPLLTVIFQIIAIGILYAVTNAIAAPYFTSVPWALPLIFLMIAIIPTIRALVTVVNAVEGQPSGPRHPQE